MTEHPNDVCDIFCFHHDFAMKVLSEFEVFWNASSNEPESTLINVQHLNVHIQSLRDCYEGLFEAYEILKETANADEIAKHTPEYEAFCARYEKIKSIQTRSEWNYDMVREQASPSEWKAANLRLLTSEVKMAENLKRACNIFRTELNLAMAALSVFEVFWNATPHEPTLINVQRLNVHVKSLRARYECLSKAYKKLRATGNDEEIAKHTPDYEAFWAYYEKIKEIQTMPEWNVEIVREQTPPSEWKAANWKLMSVIDGDLQAANIHKCLVVPNNNSNNNVQPPMYT